MQNGLGQEAPYLATEQRHHHDGRSDVRLHLRRSVALTKAANVKLYEISNALMIILDSSEEELEGDAAGQLTNLEMALEAKVEGILQFRQGLLADAEALNNESKRLKTKSDALARKAEWLKGYVHHALVQLGVGKLSTRTFSVSVCQSPPRLEIQDGAEVPFEFKREEVTVIIDKAALLAAHKKGLSLPEGITVSSGSHLRIS